MDIPSPQNFLFADAAKTFGFTTLPDLLGREYPLHLVRGVFPQIGTSVLYGAPGLGKSFIALDIALSVAAGLDVFGRPALQGSAIYLSTEGKTGMRARAEAWALSRGLDIADLPIALIEEPKNLREPAVAAPLIDRLKRLVDKSGIPCRFICIDTMSQCLFGDENSQDVMTQFAAAATKMASVLETQVCVIHHTGKDESKGARGSSVINGNYDTLLQLAAGEGEFELVLRTGKQKNGKKTALSILLEEVSCGTDRDGEEVRSLAVSVKSGETLDYDALSAPSSGKGLSDSAKTVLRVLEEAGAEGLDATEWRKRAQAAGVGPERPATAREIIKRLDEGHSVRKDTDGKYFFL